MLELGQNAFNLSILYTVLVMVLNNIAHFYKIDETHNLAFQAKYMKIVKNKESHIKIFYVLRTSEMNSIFYSSFVKEGGSV